MDEKSLRKQLAEFLGWSEAHVGWKKALLGFPEKDRGIRPDGTPHSAWELLEHVRLAQWDILEFTRNAKHKSPDWPEGYWPASPVPPSDAAWDRSVNEFHRDLGEMEKLVTDPATDLMAPVAHGSGQTLLREILLLADHSSYHLGQFILVRRLLGNWK
jgi:hypothetical protein